MTIEEALEYLIPGDTKRIATATGVSIFLVNGVRRGVRKNKLVSDAIIQLAEKRIKETKEKIEAI